MSGATSIEWTDATWNPFRGCSRISPGCERCYAEMLAARFSHEGGWGHGFAEMVNGKPRWTRKVALLEHNLYWPLHYKGAPDAIEAGRPTRIFVNSTSDIAHEGLPDEAIDDVFAAMVLAQAHGRGHIFQTLTKRAERLHAYMSARTKSLAVEIEQAAFKHFGEDEEVHAANGLSGMLGEGRNAMWPPKNVWLGVSVEDRTRKHRIAALRETPAAVRFLSLEPLLEDLGTLDLRGISWVIVGGESGRDARDCYVSWIRSIVAQSRAAGVPVFVKQLGAKPYGSCCDVHGADGIAAHDNALHLLPIRNPKGGHIDDFPEDLRIREFPKGVAA